MIKYDDESGIATVTITHYAQKSLGDVVFVELPEAGATIQQGGQWFPRSQTKFRILHSRKLADDRPYRIRWGRGERQSGLGYCAYRRRKRIKLTPHRVPFLPFFQFAPVSGEVLSINQELGDQPSLLNKSPEDKGMVLAMVLFPFRLRRMDQVGFSN